MNNNNARKFKIVKGDQVAGQQMYNLIVGGYSGGNYFPEIELENVTFSVAYYEVVDQIKENDLYQCLDKDTQTGAEFLHWHRYCGHDVTEPF